MAVNCGAIPEALLESELFGHKKGAFTDAIRDKKGLFEEANGGTLFLDEIGELPLGAAGEALRVLQEETIRRVGDGQGHQGRRAHRRGDRPRSRRRGDGGALPRGLFYRLNVLPVTLPPLRERREDIPPLVEHFIGRDQREARAPRSHGRRARGAEAALEYAWPGNVRELENTIERAMVLSDGRRIEVGRACRSGSARAATGSG